MKKENESNNFLYIAAVTCAALLLFFITISTRALKNFKRGGAALDPTEFEQLKKSINNYIVLARLLNDKLLDLNFEYENIVEVNINSKQKIDQLDTAIKTMTTNLDTVNTGNTSLKEEIKSITSLKQSLEEENSAMQNQLEDLKKTIGSLTDSYKLIVQNYAGENDMDIDESNFPEKLNFKKRLRDNNQMDLGDNDRKKKSKTDDSQQGNMSIIVDDDNNMQIDDNITENIEEGDRKGTRKRNKPYFYTP